MLQSSIKNSNFIKMKKIYSSLFFFLFSLSFFAQQKPQPSIPVEVFFGNNRANFQLSLNRQIYGKWRYNNITTTVADYDNTRSETEFVMVNSIVYQFHRNFGASGGLQYHFVKGFVPSVAFHASYASPTWLLLLTPYLNFMPERNSETIGIIEYKPQLNNNFRLYTRAQALYNYNFNLEQHDRSFYYFRLGVTVNKFSFGAAANLDYYGKSKVKKNNFGGFLKVDI